MKEIRCVEPIEEKSIDRDYNKHGKPRETHYEVLGGGIAYCVRSFIQPEIIIVYDDKDANE